MYYADLLRDGLAAEEVSQLRAEVVRLRHQLQESTEALQKANDTAEAWRKLHDAVRERMTELLAATDEWHLHTPGCPEDRKPWTLPEGPCCCRVGLARSAARAI